MRALSSIPRLCGLEYGVRRRRLTWRGVARTHKGADPVTGPISEHWFAVFAAGDKQICPIVLEKRE